MWLATPAIFLVISNSGVDFIFLVLFFVEVHAATFSCFGGVFPHLRVDLGSLQGRVDWTRAGKPNWKMGPADCVKKLQLNIVMMMFDSVAASSWIVCFRSLIILSFLSVNTQLGDFFGPCGSWIGTLLQLFLRHYSSQRFESLSVTRLIFMF